MENQQLLNYIREQLEQGNNKENIKNSLLSQGWQENDVDEAFNLIASNYGNEELAKENKKPILPNANDILKETWSIYKRKAKTLLGVWAIPALIGTIGQILALAAVFSILNLFNLGNSLIATILLIVLFVGIIAAIYAWGQMALLYAIKDEESIGIIEAYRRGWHKIIPYLLMVLLSAVIIFSGTLLLVVPGIIFAIWFSLAVFVLAFENLNGKDALLMSREYVRGKWWYAFWRLSFIVGLSMIASLLISIIFQVLSFIPGKEIVARFVTEATLMPLTTIYLYLVYKNLKSLKEKTAGAIQIGDKNTKLAIMGSLGLFTVIAVAVSIYLRFYLF